MPGPAPKPAASRIRAHRGEARPVLVNVTSRSRLAPQRPAGLLGASVAAWERLWTSPLAATFSESDVPALGRLFELRDERTRTWRVARRQRLVAGSKGQVRPNPLFGMVASFDAEIRNLEDRFGLTPRARLTLGIQLGEAHRSLSELNAAFLDEVRDDNAG